MLIENINLVVIIVVGILLALVAIGFSSDKLYSIVQFGLSFKKKRICLDKYLSTWLKENFSTEEDIVNEEYLKVFTGGIIQAIGIFDITAYGNSEEVIITEEDLRF